MTEYNMQRLPYAAEQFRSEVKDLYPDALFVMEDRDGLGIYRTLYITTDSASELWDLLEPVMESTDSRIIGLSQTSGVICVVFTGLDEAEDPAPFHLAHVRETLVEPAQEQAKTTKKTAAKKTATKKP